MSSKLEADEAGARRFGLRDRVVVVTGAAQGLGLAVARAVHALGAKVVLLDVNAEAAADAARELDASGTRAVAEGCDITDERAVAAAAERTRGAFGRCDGLVNNAGVISWTPLEELDAGEWDRVLRINLTGTFLCTKHFGRLMLEQRSGSIVNIASVAASTPEPRAGAYSPSKAAQVMLATQAAVEWGPRGVRANTVSPGIMRTPMADRFNAVPEALAARLKMIPVRRIADPDEVAAVVAFLLSDASGYVTGQNIEVDGGVMRTLIELIPRPGTPAVLD